jgi:cation:H+ antiporter
MEGASGIAIGNIFGSNIANICIILGVPIMYGCLARKEPGCGRLSLERQELSSLFFGLFISSTLPLILLRGTEYASYVGLVLVGLFVIYSYRLAKSSFVPQKTDSTHSGRLNRTATKGVTWMLAGIAGVIASGYAIVHSGSNLASAFAILGTLVGATVVAVGTSLPELAISFKSVQKGRFDFALSNAIGSCFANLTVILGLVFVFSAVAVRVDAYFDLVFFSLLSNLFLWYFISRGSLGLKEGAVLILIYVVFLAEFVAGFGLF